MIPEVSCLIAARDASPFVSQCVSSCLEQFDEVIAYDHNSKDDTKEILVDLLGDRVVLDNTNKHKLYQVRQQLLNLANCEFVVFQDADDYRLPNSVAQQKLLLKDVDILVSPYRREDGKLSKPTGNFLLDIVNDSIHFSSCIIRKEFVTPFRNRLSTEYWCLYDIYKTYGPKCLYADVVSVVHRQYSNPKALHLRKSVQIKKSRYELCDTIIAEQQLNSSTYNKIAQIRKSYASD